MNNTSGLASTHQPPSGFAWVAPKQGVAPEQASSKHHTSTPQANRERRVLFISYAFPPTGGGGVQRAVKFAKYLPSHQWQPTILTVANPSVPVQDQDLARDIDPSITIVRARTWEPGYGVKKQLTTSGDRRWTPVRNVVRSLAMQVLQPDPQILWNRAAFRAAAQTLQDQRHDAICVTGPPFSSFLLGCKLKQRFGLPLVLDFRDEWMLVGQYMENHQLSGLAYRRQWAMMRKTLKAADAVVTTTQASAAELAAHCQQAHSAATVSCIYNGYDPADFCELKSDPSPSAKLRIVYTGTLWKLTDILPLVSAIESLAGTSAARDAKGRLANIELIVAGRCTPAQSSILDRLSGTGVSLIRHDYLPHNESLRLAATADHLLLLLADQPGAERVVPAKLFEYLALQRPILAITPRGETHDLLAPHQQTKVFRPAEVKNIARWLDGQIDDRSRQIRSPGATSIAVPQTESLSRFSRPSQARELAAVLERCPA